MCGKSQGPPANGASWDRFLMANWNIYTSLRVTELQTLKGTQYTGGRNFFVSDFNKLPFSLRSQGEKCFYLLFSEIVFLVYDFIVNFF